MEIWFIGDVVFQNVIGISKEQTYWLILLEKSNLLISGWQNM